MGGVPHIELLSQQIALFYQLQTPIVFLIPISEGH